MEALTATWARRNMAWNAIAKDIALLGRLTANLTSRDFTAAQGGDVLMARFTSVRYSPAVTSRHRIFVTTLNS